ncbi:MAG: AraC family ligand binding domain-containing protein [Nitrososphaerales archaeon]|nr:AraC family ligand binding domain-containing protein [Nitrososphaerales archaeon]
MKVVKMDEVLEYEPPGQPFRRVRLLATPEDAGTSVTVGMSIYGRGMFAPAHTHSGEEIIVVTHGRGIFRGKEGEVVATPGTVLIFSPGEEHSLENRESTTLEFIFIYPKPEDAKPIKEKWKPHQPQKF